LYPPPTINTTSSSPTLDEQTIQTLKTADRLVHTFSNGEQWKLFAIGDHIFSEGGDFTVVTREGLPNLVSDIENQLASPISAQGVGNAPTATTLDGYSILWPSAKDLGVIYYEIGSFPTAIRNLIQQAINEWNATSVAIKWQPNTQGSLNPRYKYVTFVGGTNWSVIELGLQLFGSGCTLATGLSGGGVGYTNPTSQFPVGGTIYFNPSCFNNGVNVSEFVAGVQHEMGHVVGLHHEMSYCGRNNYINVNSGSALDINYFFNYAEKCDRNAKNYGVYDFDSVMGYKYGAGYGYSYKSSIFVNYCGDPRSPGFATGLSKVDIFAINLQYGRGSLSLPNCRNIRYQAHLAGTGWQSYVNAFKDGTQFAGTTGQNRPMEAIRIEQMNIGVEYRAHVANLGWLPYVSASQLGIAGTTGESRNMEAVQIRLTSNKDGCSLLYRAYVTGIGWQNWVLEDAVAGTTGQGRAMEALQIRFFCPS
jgi:Astacin (Peptidase family M12A)/Clostridial hydrophobic W